MYAYCQGDPVNFVDPGGRAAEDDETASLTLLQTISLFMLLYDGNFSWIFDALGMMVYDISNLGDILRGALFPTNNFISDLMGLLTPKALPRNSDGSDSTWYGVAIYFSNETCEKIIAAYEFYGLSSKIIDLLEFAGLITPAKEVAALLLVADWSAEAFVNGIADHNQGYGVIITIYTNPIFAIAGTMLGKPIFRSQ
jgi:hypothetical protein